jgi:hypothetical protein
MKLHHIILVAFLPLIFATGWMRQLNAAEAKGENITVTLDQPGNVSAAIYDKDGRMVRELARALPMQAGSHQFAWDGLDRSGEPLPAGDYTWKLLRNSGLQAKFLGMVGITTVEAPYDPWVGNNSGPDAVAWDETGWYLGSMASEGIPSYRKQSPDGKKRLWQKDHPEAWQGPRAMASANGTLYALQQNGKVIPMDAAASTHKTYVDDLGKVRPVCWDVLVSGDNRKGTGGSSLGSMDLDAAVGRFVVSSEKFNQVTWYSSTPLTIAHKTSEKMLKELSDAAILRQETIPAPKGVALGADGVTYVISEGAVWAIGQERKIFISAGQLSNPYRIAFDKHTGDLLVAEGTEDATLTALAGSEGEASEDQTAEEKTDNATASVAQSGHQIKRFDSSGKLTATYGRQGGRQDGPFVATDFLNIRDIAATKDGGLLVSEGGESLRRTAQFDRAGKLLGQWFGGSPFFNVASALPEKPEEIWYYAGSASLGVARMNFENGSWEPIASYTLAGHGDGLFPKQNPFKYWHVRKRNGVTYLVNDGGSPAILRLDETKGRLVPVAIAGVVRDKKKAPKLWLDAVAAQGLDPAKLTGAYAWSDLNGDGEFQSDEFRLEGTAVIQGEGNCYVDDSWNVYLGKDGTGVPWVCLPNLAPADAKAPVWDWAKAVEANASWPKEIVNMGGAQSRGIWRDAEGATYQFIAAERNPTTGDRHAAAWPGVRSGSARLIKWNADGSLAWSVGKHAHRDPFSGAAPGEYHDPTHILGITHGCVVVADRVAWPASVWTADGLYAGSFLDRRAEDGLPGSVYAWWREKRPVPGKPGEFENPQTMNPNTPIPYDVIGGFMLTLPDGDVLWMPMGENASALYRVSGWKDWERQQGTIRLSEPAQHAASTGTGLSATYFANTQLEGEPVHQRIDRRIWLGFKTDRAKWLPWSKPPVPGIEAKGFSARWTGFVEVPFNEPMTFSVYLGPTDRVRLWVNDQPVIDDWAPRNPKDRRPRVTHAAIDEVVGKPILLSPGQRVPIRLEYASEGPEQASLSLNWDSQTQERQRIPTANLYPQP